MPAFITLADASYRTPDGKLLFDKLNLVFGRELTGLVGGNGVGKSTVLKLILGELAPSEGAVARTGRVSILQQSVQPPPGARASDLLGVSRQLQLLARIEAGNATEVDLAEADWTLPMRLDAVLATVGLRGIDLRRPAASLSGGEATRAALAALLVEQPDVMLLDEPTNNLDAEARTLVARILGSWRGGAVVVSHDRALLRGMDRIIELSSLGARTYGGGYDHFAERRAAERAAAAQALDNAERAAVQVERDIQMARERQARRDAAGRRAAQRGGEPKIVLGAKAERSENTGAKGVQLAARQRTEARQVLDDARAGVERLRRLDFELPSSGLPAGKRVLTVENLSFAWPNGRRVLDRVDFEMTGPARVAVTGRNGSGKTTLLKLIAGDLEPGRGRIVRGGPIAFLDQRTAILKDGETVLANFRRLNPDDDHNACRAALAKFLFRADAALQTVATLSGGQRLRAALACVLGGRNPPQLLILDEPTNHLDLESISAVEAAVAGYDGAVLVVSHDADFLQVVGVERQVAL